MPLPIGWLTSIALSLLQREDEMGVVRGCGTRTAGGTYLCCPLSDDGKPVEYFLLDPPVVKDWEDLGVTDVGMKEFQDSDGTWHLLDVVGRKHYPNVADFIEEVRRFGLSRKIKSSFDFAKLTARSRIIMLHRSAHIENAAQHNRERECPCDRRPHLAKPYEEMCAGLWWEDVQGGEPTSDAGREVTRVMPSFSYTAMTRPGGIDPKYKLAAFANFPIFGIEVIDDPDGGKHEKALENAKRAALNVNLVEE